MSLFFVCYQFHKNTGAVTLLFFLSTSRRLAEIAAMEDKNYQLGRTINFFTNLLKDPAALSEYREAVRLEQEEK